MNLRSELSRGLAVPSSVIALLAGVLLSISCVDESECPGGYEECPCAQGRDCFGGLVCLSGYCVDPNWTPPVEGEATAGPGEEGGTYDNVAACNALVEEIECGELDLSTVIDCGLYGDILCDLTDYFDCVREAIQCVDGVPDTTGLLECNDLTTCPT